MTLLSPGDQFPTRAATLSGGDTLSPPDALASGFGVVLHLPEHGDAGAPDSRHRGLALAMPVPSKL
jgi:hypothetical protein